MSSNVAGAWAASSRAGSGSTPGDATTDRGDLLANSPLHDLAVVVRGSVVAASVQLPLAETESAQLGSRHRAAVGVTTESDCLVVIVSEETGNCRLAEHGSMTPLDRAELGPA